MRLVQSSLRPAKEFVGAMGRVASTQRFRQWTFWLAKLAIGALIIGLLVRWAGSKDTWERVASAQPLSFGLAVGLTVLQMSFFAFRWRQIASCSGSGLSFKDALIGNLELGFVNIFLPSALAGDAVRVLRARRAGMPVSRGAISVLLDRAIGLASILVLTPFALALAPPFTGASEQITIIAVAAAGLFALGFSFLYFAAPFFRRFERYRVGRFLSFTSEVFRTFVRAPRTSVVAIAASFMGYGIAAGALAYAATAISVPMSYLPALVTIGVVSLTALIPISVGGWGMREGAIVLILGMFDIGPADALGISIIYGIALTLVGLLGGLALLGLDGRLTHRRYYGADRWANKRRTPTETGEGGEAELTPNQAV